MSSLKLVEEERGKGKRIEERERLLSSPFLSVFSEEKERDGNDI